MEEQRLVTAKQAWNALTVAFTAGMLVGVALFVAGALVLGRAA